MFIKTRHTDNFVVSRLHCFLLTSSLFLSWWSKSFKHSILWKDKLTLMPTLTLFLSNSTVPTPVYIAWQPIGVLMWIAGGRYGRPWKFEALCKEHGLNFSSMGFNTEELFSCSVCAGGFWWNIMQATMAVMKIATLCSCTARCNCNIYSITTTVYYNEIDGKFPKRNPSVMDSATKQTHT